VPGKFLQQFLRENKTSNVKDFKQEIRRQLLANQANYMQALLAKPFPVKKLGDYQVPAKLASYINWLG